MFAGYDPLVNSALLTVLHQEIDRFNHLLSVMHSSLNALQQAVRGEIILNKVLEELYNSLGNLKVPELWQVSASTFIKLCFYNGQTHHEEVLFKAFFWVKGKIFSTMLQYMHTFQRLVLYMLHVQKTKMVHPLKNPVSSCSKLTVLPLTVKSQKVLSALPTGVTKLHLTPK